MSNPPKNWRYDSTQCLTLLLILVRADASWAVDCDPWNCPDVEWLLEEATIEPLPKICVGDDAPQPQVSGLESGARTRQCCEPVPTEIDPEGEHCWQEAESLSYAWTASFASESSDPFDTAGLHELAVQVVGAESGQRCPDHGPISLDSASLEVLQIEFDADEIEVEWAEDGEYDVRDDLTVDSFDPAFFSWSQSKIEGAAATISSGGIFSFGSGAGKYQVTAEALEHCQDTVELSVVGQCESESSYQNGPVHFVFEETEGEYADGWCLYSDLEFGLSMGPFTFPGTRLTFKKHATTGAYAGELISWSGEASGAVAIDSATASLKLTEWTAGIANPPRFFVQSVAGSLELTSGGNSLTLQASAGAEGEILLDGSGILKVSLGSLPILLDFSQLGLSYDFQTVKPTAATGTAVLGDAEGEHVSLTIAYQNEALKLTGVNGALSGSAGGFTLELTVDDFKADYNFESLAVTAFSGGGKLKKGDTLLAEATLELQDSMITGQYSVSGSPSYSSHGFSMEIIAFDVSCDYDLGQNQFKLRQGSATINVANIQNVDGDVRLTVGIENGTISAAIDGQGTSLSAFGMTLSDFNLQADLDQDLEIQKIQGSLKAQHDELEGQLVVNSFKVEEGELKELSLSGNVKYSGFELTVTEASFVDAPEAQLMVTAKVAVVEVGQVQVSDFTIKSSGALSLGEISGDIHKPPIDVSFSATFEENRFKGEFSGSFTPGVGIEGEIDIGSNGPESDPWIHLYGSLALTVPGVPLGQTGLKLTTVGGAFGFNYDAGAGSPLQGAYGLGLTLGISDLADMFALVGTTYVQFGPTLLIIVEGELSVPGTNSLATGELSVNYTLPGGSVSGTIGSTIKVPPGTGQLVNIDNQTLLFNFNDGTWSISGSGLGGTVLSVIQLSNGSVNFGNSNGSLAGSIGGQASFSAEGAYTVAEIECDSTLDSGLVLSYDVELSGNVAGSLTPSSVSGSFGLNASGTASAEYKLPFGDCNSLSLSLNGSLNVTLGTQLCLDGTLSYTPSLSPIPNNFSLSDVCP